MRNRFVGVVTHRNCYVAMPLNETGLQNREHCHELDGHCWCKLCNLIMNLFLDSFASPPSP